MDLNSMMEGKREWRALQARVKALPRDYQIVYKELQKYVFKVGPMESDASVAVLIGIAGLFEEGAAEGKSALEVTGSDVAAFADALLKDTPTP